MLRHGYQACNSCHISPSGGGILTPYGRMISEEVLSTWFYKGESSPGHYDVGLPDFLAVGGDVRYVNIRTTTLREKNSTYRFIPMQKDIAFGVKIAEMWLIAGYGLYNDKTQESRLHEIVYSPNPTINIRAGKFLPTYGLLGQDHTAFNRSLLGLGEGDESYNFEASAHSPFGELFLTWIGMTKDLSDAEHPTYSTAKNGVAGKLTLFATKYLQLGGSLLLLRTINTEKILYGGFFSFGLGKLFASSDLNEVSNTGETAKFSSYSKLSYEVYRGINLFYENNYAKLDYLSSRQNNVGVEWFPRPHFDFLAKALFLENATGALLMSHYYF